MTIQIGENIIIQEGKKKRKYLVHFVFGEQVHLEPTNPKDKYIIIEKQILPQTVRPYRLDFKTRKPI